MKDLATRGCNTYLRTEWKIQTRAVPTQKMGRSMERAREVLMIGLEGLHRW